MMKSTILCSIFFSYVVFATNEIHDRNGATCFPGQQIPAINSEVSSFCKDYFQAPHTKAPAIPAFLSDCKGISSAVSSVCSCVLATTTSTSCKASTTTTTAKPTSKTCTEEVQKAITTSTSKTTSKQSSTTSTTTSKKSSTTCTSTPKQSSTSTTTSQPCPCNADNCARAVTGTYQGLATESVHRSDCSSFLMCTSYPQTQTVTATQTVYPSTQTVTVYRSTAIVYSTYSTLTAFDTTVLIPTAAATVTVTAIDELTALETVTESIQLKRRSVSPVASSPSGVVCPTAVPAYASACSGTSRYSSACSCYGYTKSTVTATTPTTTITATATGQSTVTLTQTATIISSAVATDFETDFITIATTATATVIETLIDSVTAVVIETIPAATATAYCENGQQVNGLASGCTTDCSTTNLRIEGSEGTVYEGTILSGPMTITTASGGTHVCDGTNNGANTTPFDNAITTLVSARNLCDFAFDGTYDNNDFSITTIGQSSQHSNEYWGFLLNYALTPGSGCETEVHSTDEVLWAYNAFNVNFFLRVEPTQTPVVLAPGETMTFAVQGSDGEGNFAAITGATFNGQLSDANGNVVFTAPTTPGTYRYKATRSDSIRSNAVTIEVVG